MDDAVGGAIRHASTDQAERYKIPNVASLWRFTPTDKLIQDAVDPHGMLCLKSLDLFVSQKERIRPASQLRNDATFGRCRSNGHQAAAKAMTPVDERASV